METKTRVGVAITTHNRRELLLAAIPHWLNNMPGDAVLVIVDDGSDQPLDHIDGATIIRHDYPLGIAAAKNRCISALIDAGCDHLFLADDDVWPTDPGWWKPYIDSPEPHLSYQWAGGHRVKVDYADEYHFAVTFPRGVMLYAEARVIDTVGGMATHYGAHGGEHVDWSYRIHAAGLTMWPFADVTGSCDLWYSRDQSEGNTLGSSRFDVRERRRICAVNGAHWARRWPGWPHFPHRDHATMQDYQLGPRLADTYEGTLDHILGLHPFGAAVEFGVGEGHSLRRIAKRMRVTGFDSFEGLPERWRDGFDKGMFACTPPNIPNATLAPGWFTDALPAFDFGTLGPIGLWHFDADLYSSTVTILDHIGPHLLPGAYIVFDEYHGYPGHEDHEMKAWREFADHAGIGWTVVGHGPEQWAIRLL